MPARGRSEWGLKIGRWREEEDLASVITDGGLGDVASSFGQCSNIM